MYVAECENILKYSGNYESNVIATQFIRIEDNTTTITAITNDADDDSMGFPCLDSIPMASHHASSSCSRGGLSLGLSSE